MRFFRAKKAFFFFVLFWLTIGAFFKFSPVLANETDVIAETHWDSQVGELRENRISSEAFREQVQGEFFYLLEMQKFTDFSREEFTQAAARYPEIRSILIEYLDSANDNVRRTAIKVLCYSLPSRDVRDVFLRKIQSVDHPLDAFYVRSFTGRLDEVSSPFIILLARLGKSEVGAVALSTLARSPHVSTAEAVEALRMGLKETGLVRDAIWGLRVRADSNAEARRILLELAQNRGALQADATGALYECVKNHEEVRRLLMKLIDDSDDDVKRAAILALGTVYNSAEVQSTFLNHFLVTSSPELEPLLGGILLPIIPLSDLQTHLKKFLSVQSEHNWKVRVLNRLEESKELSSATLNIVRSYLGPFLPRDSFWDYFAPRQRAFEHLRASAQKILSSQTTNCSVELQK